MDYFKRTILIITVCLFLMLSLLQSACDIKKPVAPEWDITANLPIINKYYYIFDMLKHTSNIFYDSTNRNNVVFTGSSKTTNQFGTDIKSDGVSETSYIILTNYSQDTTLPISFDDSTQASFISFLNGNLIIKFNGASVSSYSVTLTLENLRSKADTSRKYFIDGLTVPPHTTREISIPLVNWIYKTSGNLSNSIILKLRTTSAGIPELTTFTSKVTAYEVERLIGRLKPTYIARETEKVDSPFGTDTPEGVINFADVDSTQTYLLVKRYTTLYQLDLSQVSLLGINKSGRKMHLRYKQSGGPPSLNDTLFKLRLDQNQDSVVIKLNKSNSNIAEFIGNMPINIYLSKALTINQNYSTGEIYYLDSFSVNANFSVPLNFSVSLADAVSQNDTTDFGIDQDQIDQIKKTQNLEIELRLTNAISLSILSKINVLDSFFVPLFSLSQIVGNQPDSSVSVSRAPTDNNGFVNGSNQKVYNAVVGKDIIDKILRAGKVIYSSKFYTDQSPSVFVRITKNDYTRLVGLGKIEYRIKENN
ncbi:MAG TPA: hypothetical protein VIK14_10475 [Ignavibacteria bacterium]